MVVTVPARIGACVMRCGGGAARLGSCPPGGANGAGSGGALVNPDGPLSGWVTAGAAGVSSAAGAEAKDWVAASMMSAWKKTRPAAPRAIAPQAAIFTAPALSRADE